MRREEEAANLSQLRVWVLFNAQVCGILRRPTDRQAQWAERSARLIECGWRTKEEKDVCSKDMIEVGKREKIA